MTDIFIPVYLDEDVDVLVANLLESRGFQATTAQQAGQLGRTDAEQLAFSMFDDIGLNLSFFPKCTS